jgi:glutamate dehydrogenase (NADP+)
LWVACSRVITASDSSGTVVDEAGFTTEKLARLCEIKASRDGRVADYAREFGLTYMEGKQPWAVPVDIALPCATQNELDIDAARQLVANGVKAVAEGANMPMTSGRRPNSPGLVSLWRRCPRFWRRSCRVSC